MAIPTQVERRLGEGWHLCGGWTYVPRGQAEKRRGSTHPRPRPPSRRRMRPPTKP